MILTIPKPIPDYALKALQEVPVVTTDRQLQVRTCEVSIPEEDAFTYIHPESFDFCDVYGKCELAQIIQDGKEQPAVATSYEFAKNERSFEMEAAIQQGVPTSGPGIILVIEPEERKQKQVEEWL